MAEFQGGDLVSIDHVTIVQWKAFHERGRAVAVKGDASGNKNRSYWNDRLNGWNIRVAVTEDWDELAFIQWVDADQFICSTRVDAFSSQDESLEFMKSLAEDLVNGYIQISDVKLKKTSA